MNGKTRPKTMNKIYKKRERRNKRHPTAPSNLQTYANRSTLASKFTFEEAYHTFRSENQKAESAIASSKLARSDPIVEREWRGPAQGSRLLPYLAFRSDLDLTFASIQFYSIRFEYWGSYCGREGWIGMKLQCGVSLVGTREELGQISVSRMREREREGQQ